MKSRFKFSVWQLVALALLIAFAAIFVVVGQIGVEDGVGQVVVSISPTLTSPWPTVRTKTPTATSSPTLVPAPTSTPTTTPTVTSTRTPTPTPTPTPIIVNPKIQALGRLETAQYVMQTVIDLEREPNNIWQKVVGNDKLLLIAEGRVVLGFDLTKVKDSDVEVDGRSVRLILPPPEILYVGIDEEKTYVYERETGLFVKPDPELETEARQLAQRSVLNWTLEHDAINKAEEFGVIYMESFLRSLGFTDIEIKTYQELEVGNDS